MRSEYDVIALGELLIDFACKETDADGYPVMAAHPGGAPANFLAALTRFGAKTSMIGKVGADTFGKLLLGTLEKAGIGTEGMIEAPDVFTTLAFVTFDPDGDRHFAFARKPGADTCLRKDEISTGLLDRTRILHFGTLSLTDEPARSATQFAVAYAKEHGKLITFDPNLRRPLWNDLAQAKEQMLWGLRQADVVKISDEEVSFLFGDISYEEAAQKLLNEFGIRLVLSRSAKTAACLQTAMPLASSLPSPAFTPSTPPARAIFSAAPPSGSCSRPGRRRRRWTARSWMRSSALPAPARDSRRKSRVAFPAFPRSRMSAPARGFDPHAEIQEL